MVTACAWRGERTPPSDDDNDADWSWLSDLLDLDGDNGELEEQACVPGIDMLHAWAWAKRPHTCALKATNVMSGGPPPSGGWYNEGQCKQLLQAWQALGINDQPIFQKTHGVGQSGFVWQEQLRAL